MSIQYPSSQDINASNITVLRAPYLQTVFADSASVLWVTDKGKSCSIKYGTDFNNLSQFKEGLIDANGRNEVTVTGLQPGTRYYYAAYTNNKLIAQDSSYYFHTAPSNRYEKFSFYAMGDIGEPTDKKGFQHITAMQIDKVMPRLDFGIGLGDIVYMDGESKHYDEYFFDPLASILKNILFYPVMGNHDWNVDPGLNFKQEWKLPNNENYFSFDYNNAHFIGLDSRKGGAL